MRGSVSSVQMVLKPHDVAASLVISAARRWRSRLSAGAPPQASTAAKHETFQSCMRAQMSFPKQLSCLLAEQALCSPAAPALPVASVPLLLSALVCSGGNS